MELENNLLALMENIKSATYKWQEDKELRKREANKGICKVEPFFFFLVLETESKTITSET